MNKKIIVAIDTREKSFYNDIIGELSPFRPTIKVGMELFFTFGPDIVRDLKSKGFDIFLDLKLHDIPNTVKKTIYTLAQLNIDIINIHALGSQEMMLAAREGLVKAMDDFKLSYLPKLIAVTHLTSLTDNIIREDLGIKTSLLDSTLHLSKLAYHSQLDGVVCSAHEVTAIKSQTHESFLTITPGIRLTAESKDDQKRIMTPAQAFKQGSDYIVIGRPITQSHSPSKAFKEILESL